MLMSDRHRKTKRGLRLSLCAAVCLVLIGGLAGAAHAQEDEEDTFEQKILKKLLGLNNQAPIEYRERSPLVVPPNHDLPPPEVAGAAIHDPSWPVDADVKRQKELAKARRAERHKSFDEEARALTPEQLNRGRVARGRAAGDLGGSVDSGRAFLPSELGYKGGIFGTLFGGKPKEDVATFTGEPTRESLTDPPPGYQTPSPAYPYGLAAEKYKPKTFRFEDRGITEN
jgi:hypothetical protein